MINFHSLSNKTILVTGSAGFIGFHLVKSLLEIGCNVVGIDNLNDYYSPALKLSRLEQLNSDFQNIKTSQSSSVEYKFIKMDISDRKEVELLFDNQEFDIVVNLAAQAGVRYSLDNPHAYIDSNLVGFLNILEGCRHHNVKHLVYASSSSVYGMNSKQPFSSGDHVDYPISLYAATKKSNELMAHAYSHLYKIPTTGLRFFTVYGPWGRPDMAYFKFTKAILEGNAIEVYNHGRMKRDFTYIDDIVDGITRVMCAVPTICSVTNKDNSQKITTAEAPYKIYNIGNSQPVSLRRFINAIENACGKKAIEKSLPMQAGDVPVTYADIDELRTETGFKPRTEIEEGVKAFVEWFADYNSPA